MSILIYINLFNGLFLGQPTNNVVLKSFENLADKLWNGGIKNRSIEEKNISNTLHTSVGSRNIILIT